MRIKDLTREKLEKRTYQIPVRVLKMLESYCKKTGLVRERVVSQAIEDKINKEK